MSLVNLLVAGTILMCTLESCFSEIAISVENYPADSNSAHFFKIDPSDSLVYRTGIRSVLRDSKGNLWFGSHQEGVACFDGDTIIYYTVENGLSDNQIRTIQEDEKGVIWFGTGNGVSSFSDGKIISHHVNVVGKDKLNHYHARLSSSNLWFSAGEHPGFIECDGGLLNFVRFNLESDTVNGLSHAVTAFSQGGMQFDWIATYSAVLGYDGENFMVLNNKYFHYDDKLSVESLHVRSVLEDSRGRLWIGNNGIGVLLWEEDNTIEFSKLMGLINSETRGGNKSPQGTMEHVFAIAEDSDGNIWFGDRDTGAWKYDGKGMTNYIVDKNLDSQHIWAIYEDVNGDLLFAMGSGGVYFFDGKSFTRKY